MDRRKYLKSMMVGTASAGVLLQSCEVDKKTTPVEEGSEKEFTIDRTPAELKYERSLLKDKFFDDHEMKTISVLADIIIPKDDVSGSATDAKVPEFIEFIVKDMPRHQTPLRGGLKWLDLQCLKKYEKDFISCSSEEQIQMVDEIAFPEKAKPEMAAGVSFFNLMRDLTATGFFTSEIGIKDLGYMGNRPNQWDGVPQEVLTQYGLQYDQKTLDLAPKFS
jgi:gluconate 2-dehydrogenase gamma chain